METLEALRAPNFHLVPLTEEQHSHYEFHACHYSLAQLGDVVAVNYELDTVPEPYASMGAETWGGYVVAHIVDERDGVFIGLAEAAPDDLVGVPGMPLEFTREHIAYIHWPAV